MTMVWANKAQPQLDIFKNSIHMVQAMKASPLLIIYSWNAMNHSTYQTTVIWII